VGALPLDWPWRWRAVAMRQDTIMKKKGIAMKRIIVLAAIVALFATSAQAEFLSSYTVER
jgi:hypothetical protein